MQISFKEKKIIIGGFAGIGRSPVKGLGNEAPIAVHDIQKAARAERENVLAFFKCSENIDLSVGLT